MTSLGMRALLGLLLESLKKPISAHQQYLPKQMMY